MRKPEVWVAALLLLLVIWSCVVWWPMAQGRW
jgi:hypothetical protein